MHVSMTSLLYTCNCVVSIHKLEIVVMHCNHASYACVVHDGIYVKEKKDTQLLLKDQVDS